MKQSLVILSIGPVQGFIAQARRAGDLYAGSFLLSTLMKEAVELMEPYLLYPQPQIPNMPNKLVALMPEDEAIRRAKQAEEVIRWKWQELAGEALGRMLKFAGNGDEFLKRMWASQIRQFPEVYWVIYPFQDEFLWAYNMAHQAFSARKLLRNFQQVEEPGPKCTVCGQRAALHCEDENARDFWSKVSGHKEVSKALLRPDGRERLCAICAVKRFSKTLRPEHFPSVSHVATADFKARLLERLKTELVSDLNELLALLSREGFHRVDTRLFPYLVHLTEQAHQTLERVAKDLLSYDGDVLFSDTFRPRRLWDSYGKKVSEREAQEWREKVENLYKVVKSRPSPYYAILMMDGDRMGKRLSGVEDPEMHKRISETLARFAGEEVKRIVEEDHPGKVVYAGGDDVLALLPVKHALPAAREIRDAMVEVMRPLLPNFTVSAGIAIAHHLYPLEATLQHARKTERAAKDEYNRDAVAVIFLKRSGEWERAGGGWKVVDEVERLREYFAKGWLASRFAPLLAYEAEVMEELDEEAAYQLLKRLVARQSAPDFPEEKGEELARALKDLANSIKQRGKAGMAETAKWVSLARFLSKEE
jgi:CRISPR-associated protein Cmr2